MSKGKLKGAAFAVFGFAVCSVSPAWADSENSYNDFYGGVLAGRDKTTSELGGEGMPTSKIAYGFLVGKNFAVGEKVFIGAEAGFQKSSNSFTGPVSTPMSVPFTTATIEKGRTIRVTGRIGFVASQVAFFGLFGYANSNFEYFVDGMPVAAFFGRGSSSDSIGGLMYGVGVEIRIPDTPLRLRGQYTRTKYQTTRPDSFGLTSGDFGFNDLEISHTTSEFTAGLIITF